MPPMLKREIDKSHVELLAKVERAVARYDSMHEPMTEIKTLLPTDYYVFESYLYLNLR